MQLTIKRTAKVIDLFQDSVKMAFSVIRIIALWRSLVCGVVVELLCPNRAATDD